MKESLPKNLLLRKVLTRTICELKDKTPSLTLGKVTCVTFPKVREGVFSFNSQFALAKTFLSKRSFGNKSFFKVNCQSDKIVSNSLEFKNFGFFQTWSSW